MSTRIYLHGGHTTDLSAGRTYIPPLAGLGQSMTAMTVVPVVSALLGPVVGLASAKAVISHFRYLALRLFVCRISSPSVHSVMVMELSQVYSHHMLSPSSC